MWSEDLQRGERGRIKNLEDNYADICQFKCACDIEFVDLSAMIPGSYEHHKLSAIIERSTTCLSEHSWRALHGITRIGGHYIDTFLIAQRNTSEDMLKYWNSRPQNDYVLPNKIMQPQLTVSTNDEKLRRVEEVLRGLIGTSIWDKENGLYIQLYAYKKITADFLTAAKWRTVHELVDLLADKTEWRIGFKQKASFSIDITSSSPALTCLYLANLCTVEYDIRKVKSVASDVQHTSHIGRFASFLRRIREAGPEHIKDAISLVLEGFGEEQHSLSVKDVNIDMIMRMGTPEHFTIIYREETLLTSKEKIHKNIYHACHTSRRLITNENTTTFTLDEILEWGRTHKRAMVMQSHDNSLTFSITDKPINTKIHEEVLSLVHDKLRKALEEKKNQF